MLVHVPGEWELVDTYYFPTGQEPWKRHNKAGKKNRAMASYQDQIATLAREQITLGECLGKKDQADDTVRLMVIFTFYTGKAQGDQTNNAKSIEDALNRIAWHDDKQNRNVLIFEVITEDKHESTKVEIYKEKQTT